MPESTIERMQQLAERGPIGEIHPPTYHLSWLDKAARKMFKIE